MKSFLVCVLVILSVCLFAEDINQYKQLKEYPIGFWNYVGANQQDKSAVKDWKDLGMSIAMSPTYSPGCDKAQFIALLDECEKNNIKVIVCDSRSYWSNLDKGVDAYKKGFQEALNDFGSHPAVIGFHIGDEPNRKDLDNCLQACTIQKEMAPNLSPFFNLVPWFDEDFIRNHTGFQTLEEYTDYIFEHSPCQILSYDCYCQMNKGDGEWYKYFNNLNVFHKAAVKHNVPFFNNALSVAHYDYRCPNMDEIRWQLNTSVAHGANGMIWFFIYNRVREANYRYAAINEFGEKTRTFEDLSYENRKLRLYYNELLPKLTLKEVYHVNKSYADTPIFEGNDIVKSVSNSKDLPAIISFFNDGYIALVNNSMTENVRGTVTFTNKVQKVYAICDNGKEEEVYPKPRAYYDLDKKSVTVWMAPGGMEIYRIVK